ncbi:MAG TPA: hypothetical protein PLD59_10795, partial [Tepidisphaeraceae bacterium]|nr:hypothetical protein [Tepidisphaeraceae bacterium]
LPRPPVAQLHRHTVSAARIKNPAPVIVTGVVIMVMVLIAVFGVVVLLLVIEMQDFLRRRAAGRLLATPDCNYGACSSQESHCETKTKTHNILQNNDLIICKRVAFRNNPLSSIVPLLTHRFSSL